MKKYTLNSSHRQPVNKMRICKTWAFLQLSENYCFIKILQRLKYLSLFHRTIENNADNIKKPTRHKKANLNKYVYDNYLSCNILCKYKKNSFIAKWRHSNYGQYCHLISFRSSNTCKHLNEGLFYFSCRGKALLCALNMLLYY